MAETAELASFGGFSVGDRVSVYLAVRENAYDYRFGTVVSFHIENRLRIRVDLDEPANGRTRIYSEQRYLRKLSLLELIAIAAR